MTNEWEPKPPCFGDMKRDNMAECKECGHMQACLGVTYLATMKEFAEKHKPPDSPPESFIPSNITTYKSPTPEQMAKACKQAFDAFIKVGFDKMEALHLTVRFADHVLPLEELKIPPKCT